MSSSANYNLPSTVMSFIDKQQCLLYEKGRQYCKKLYKGGKIIVAKPSCNLGKPTNYICRKANVIDNYITRHSEVQVQALACIRKIKKDKET